MFTGNQTPKTAKNGVREVAQYGDKIGNLGVMVKNPNITPNWATANQHMFNRMDKYGITKEMFESWVKNGTAIQQDANTILYLNREGVAVMSISGRPITTYGADSFIPHIVEAIKKIFGK